MSKKVIFSDEQIKEMIYLYQEEKIPSRALGKKFNVSKNIILRVLKENGVVTNLSNHKYKADYDKFELIDSPEKAYWLGFLAADGCNYQREENASIIVNLHQKDRNHLEKFKTFMESNVNITDYIQDCGFSNHTPMSKIVFNSKKMSKDLEDKGVPPRKSLILKPPKIEERFFLPYILGYFDGDGSIFKTSQNEYGISILGTKELLEWINNILQIGSLEQKVDYQDKNNYTLRCGGIQKPFLIMKKLYDSVNTHLDRKYEIYKSLETVVLERNFK